MDGGAAIKRRSPPRRRPCACLVAYRTAAPRRPTKVGLVAAAAVGTLRVIGVGQSPTSVSDAPRFRRDRERRRLPRARRTHSRTHRQRRRRERDPRQQRMPRRRSSADNHRSPQPPTKRAGRSDPGSLAALGRVNASPSRRLPPRRVVSTRNRKAARGVRLQSAGTAWLSVTSRFTALNAVYSQSPWPDSAPPAAAAPRTLRHRVTGRRIAVSASRFSGVRRGTDSEAC
jgi:hypothetical protein